VSDAELKKIMTAKPQPWNLGFGDGDNQGSKRGGGRRGSYDEVRGRSTQEHGEIKRRKPILVFVINIGTESHVKLLVGRIITSTCVANQDPVDP
jgi:hypothetical protein